MPISDLTEIEKNYIRNERSFKCKPGDRAYVFRKANDYENGWRYPWIREMDATIGNTGIILSAENDGHGILIDFGFDKFYYPYTCLNIIR